MSDEMSVDELQRYTQWEKRVIEELHATRLIVERQTTLLEQYIKKVDTLAEEFKPVQRHVIVTQAIGKGFMGLVAVGATLKLLHDAYQYLFV